MAQFSGARLRSARREAGVRLEQLGVDIAKSVDSIRKYESGEVDPPASVVRSLAEPEGVDRVLEIPTGTHYIGALNSARFAQPDGSVLLDLSGSFVGTITAMSTPRNTNS